MTRPSPRPRTPGGLPVRGGPGHHPRTFDDHPNALTPSPRHAVGDPAPDPWRVFGRLVAELHQVGPAGPGEMPMCSCGAAAVTCAYRCLMRRTGVTR